MPLPLRTSTVPEKDEFYSKLVEKCVAVIVDTLGRDNIRAVLMIGAPARSEVTVVEVPDGYYSLSDIDLVCACRCGTNLESLRGKLAPAMSALNEELSGVCTGVDVAMKSEVELAEPQPLISTYEMIRSPIVVWGDDRVVSTLGDIDIADVQVTESLVLMHNRVTEKLLVRLHESDETPSTLAALMCLYGTAKMVLDSITAYLFLRNNVPTRFTDRVDYFLSDVLERPESLKLKTRLRDYLDELPAWARFKTTGDLSVLATALGHTPGDSDLVPFARDAWERYIGYADVFWRAILSDASRDDATECDLVHIGRIYERLEKSPRSVVRAFKMLKQGRAPEGLFSAPRVLWRSRLGSPRLLAYLTAILTYLSYSHSDDWDCIDRMIMRYCPFALPSGYRSFTTNQKREAVIKQLRLLHHGVLLGRKGK